MAEQRTTGDGIHLSKIMLDFLNSYDKKLATFTLERWEDQFSAMMLQQLSSAVVETQYIQRDKYIGNWSFSVYLRINNPDTAERIDACKCLSDLAEWCLNNKPDLLLSGKQAISIEMTASPHISAQGDNGEEEWQVIFMLRYKNLGGNNYAK